ncbi:hypothetical protein KHA93_06515 [Bacillus sp. FJAT-49732]|uniref:Uncharacterized protein n=1 Tax=Lederbergia citrisecunda TaxID=2833583 RepID=A0A942YK57_9BACI|nr:hypothetical protein [Lederbergia citrisecunda]MBS4199307.1 hypothetical protein [Lederbergia citrisecunda]
MGNYYRLAELGKLKKREAITFVLVFFLGMLLILFYIPIFQLIISALLFSATMYLLVQVSKNKIKDYPLGFKVLLYLLLLSFAFIFLLTLINNQIIYGYGLVAVLFAYLYVTGVFIYYLINVLYYWGLKKMFPFEREPEVNRFLQISQKKLSKYIELDKQKVFYNISLINSFLYFLFVLYGMLCFIKFTEGDHVAVLGILSSWVKAQEWLNFSNGISVVSLLLAIYTITIPVQNKIIKEARENYKEKYQDFIK